MQYFRVKLDYSTSHGRYPVLQRVSTPAIDSNGRYKVVEQNYTNIYTRVNGLLKSYKSFPYLILSGPITEKNQYVSREQAINLMHNLNKNFDLGTNNFISFVKEQHSKLIADEEYFTYSSKTLKSELTIEYHEVGNLIYTPVWLYQGDYYNESGIKSKTKASFVIGNPSAIKVTLSTSSYILAESNNWELGQTYGGYNVGSDYCFYCSDNVSSSYPLQVSSFNKSKVHSDNTHSGGTNSGSSVTNDYNSEYSLNDMYPSMQTVSPNGYGVRGTYIDGVASIPFVMIELSSPDFAGSYNISIPADSFIALTHKRNLSDSYNTFSLQLFDKNALNIEAKVVLGFRNITFYYTDFVSTSKRFTGQILDYETVITGKGLMLTMTGYTSNIKSTALSQESIPWSLLVSANDYEFYYWTNKQGEYLGAVRYDESLHSGSKNGLFTSESGDIVTNHSKNIVDMIKSGDADYYLKTNEDEWVSWDDFYGDKAEDDLLNSCRPYPALWSLSSYNGDIGAVIKGDDESFTWSDSRPSDIVKAICIINGWKWKKITKTQKSTITDQVSRSYTEYIKEVLIPISISDDGNSSCQYYFWFDDEGYANYSPKAIESPTKTLIFNGGKDKPDTYPLIGFTAASNGAMALMSDATNYLEAINIYTGDKISVSAISASDSLSSQYKSTSEWYETNSLTKKTSGTGSVNAKDTSAAINYSSTSVPSTEDLQKMLVYRYGIISKYSYSAQLDVWGCTDITPGESIEVQIYLGDNVRSTESTSEESSIVDSSGKTVKVYRGNITMHHTSGKYFVNEITDTISGGKFVSSLKCLKIDDSVVLTKSSDTESSMDYDDGDTCSYSIMSDYKKNS